MKRSLLVGLLIVLNIVFDQVTKIWVRNSVIPNSKTEIIGDYFTLRNVENAGAFLGMGSDLNPLLSSIFLKIIPVLVMLYLIFYIIKNKDIDRVSLIGFACIIGGGIANIFDRFRFGHVTDFFHIDLGGVFKTGIFNVADMSVMLGLGLLIFSSFKKKKTA